MPTPEECVDAVGQALRTDRKRSAGLDATYQFILTGKHAGEWWIRADAGKGDVGAGRCADPTVTITTTDETFVKLATGQLTGTEAFATGQVQVSGDRPMAIYLPQIFGTA